MQVPGAFSIDRKEQLQARAQMWEQVLHAPAFSLAAQSNSQRCGGSAFCDFINLFISSQLWAKHLV